MSLKKFLNQQFQWRSFLLKHDVTSDFYLSCFQRNRSAIPLLIVRTIIFVGCLCIWIASMVLTTLFMPINYWPIYMTHWGLVLNTIAAGFGLMISVMAWISLPIDKNSGLPWYVQLYWAMFNVAAPIAFFITIFYWTLLFGLVQDFAFDLTLDIFIHAINSVLMVALLVCSRHPAYFYHFYFCIVLAYIYLLFTYVYFVLGGVDASGEHTIYPMIDWKKPGETMIIVALCTVGYAVMHGVVVVLAVLRDAVSRPFRKDSTAYDIHETY